MSTSIPHSLLKGTKTPINPSLLEAVFAVLALLLLSRAWSSFMFANTAPGEAVAAINAPIRLLLFMTVYVVSAALLLWHWRTALDSLLRQKFILMLLLLGLASPLWSVNPPETLEKMFGIIGGSVFAIYLTHRFTHEAMLRMLAWTLGIIVVGSYFTVWLYPESGLMQGGHEGLWQGALRHKNQLGFHAVIAAACFFTMAICHRKHRSLYLTGFLLSLILLTMSCSKTSLLNWAIVFTTLSVFLACSGRRRFAVIALASTVLVLGCFLMQTQLQLMPPMVAKEAIECIEQQVKGDDAPCNIIAQALAQAPRSVDFNTGQGRMELWGHLWVKIQEAPILGYGPGGFWLGMNGPSAYIWERETWHPPTSHNGYIELTVQLGIVGLVLFLLGTVPLVVYVVRAGLSRSLSDTNTVYAAMLAALLLGNLGESTLMAPNKLSWVLMVVLTFRLWFDYSALRQKNADNE